MKIHLIGPMTGCENRNAAAFAAAAEALRAENHEVFNPSEFDQSNPDMKWAEYLAEYLPKILRQESDAMGALPGWWWSKGSFLEAQAAWPVGTPLFDLDTRRRIEFRKHGNFLVQEFGEEFSLE